MWKVWREFLKYYQKKLRQYIVHLLSHAIMVKVHQYPLSTCEAVKDLVTYKEINKLHNLIATEYTGKIKHAQESFANSIILALTS